MSYTFYRRLVSWSFRPLSPSFLVFYLRASIRFAIPVNNVPSAINISIINLVELSFFFFFFLLICFSPPYKYIIQYGVPYVNTFRRYFFTVPPAP